MPRWSTAANTHGWSFLSIAPSIARTLTTPILFVCFFCVSSFSISFQFSITLKQLQFLSANRFRSSIYTLYFKALKQNWIKRNWLNGWEKKQFIHSPFQIKHRNENLNGGKSIVHRMNRWKIKIGSLLKQWQINPNLSITHRIIRFSALIFIWVLLIYL